MKPAAAGHQWVICHPDFNIVIISFQVWGGRRQGDTPSNIPCQMLAGRMDFHLIAFELVQLLPYRRLQRGGGGEEEREA